MNTTATRIPPHSIEAERGVIGCVLLAPMDGVNACRDVFGSGDEWLYDPRHQLIFRTIEKLLASAPYVDLVTLTAELSGDKLEKVGGYAYLTSLMDGVPSAANLGYYLAIVREKALLRGLIRTCTRLAGDAYECPSASVAGLMDRAQAQVAETCSESPGGDSCTGAAAIATAANDYAQQLFERANSHSRPEGVVLTGLQQFDDMVCLEPGKFCVIGARPSVGKTSLATTIAINAARAGDPVGFLSLEMMGRSIGLKMACGIGRVSLAALKHRGGMTHESFDQLSAGIQELAGLPFYVEDSSRMDIWRARAVIRSMKRKYGIKVAIVDYLQLVDGEKSENRQTEVASVSRGLKAIAKEVGIPLIVLAQLNRDSEKSKREPIMSDLRESGAVEADADVIAMLHQPEDQADPDNVEVKVIIAKNREGQTGKIALMFRKRFTLFESMPAVDAADYQTPYADA